MLFNSLAFWVFFAVVVVLTYAVPARWSKAVLVVASFIFYGLFNPALMALLAACTVFNHGTGLAIGRAGPRGAKAWLAVAVVADLGLLAFFKYTGLLAATVTNLLHLPPSDLAARIVLPVAISFYTFEAISYNVDVYRRALAPRRNLVDFALFISFFPHLVAGPIIRPAHFFPQLDRRPVPSGEAVAWGVVQIVKGLIKKTVFADSFAVIANGYFDAQAGGHVGQGGAVAAWVGVLAFSMQIYFDFSGYTDIARGCARLLGYDFPPNFERPYLARDIAAFWRRWHISLSTWLRDYLYIPLGGSRGGSVRTYVNLLATMALGGLWHGASWNFLLWGVYHGVLLGLHRAWSGWRGVRAGPGTAVGDAASVGLTFLLVTVGWVTFRVVDFGTTLLVLRDLVTIPPAWSWDVPREMTVLMVVMVLWLLLDRGRRLQRWLSTGTGVGGTIKVSTALAVSLLVLELFSRTDIAVPFIYFQF